MIFKLFTILLLSTLFLGCSPKKLFPTFNDEYDSIDNYPYKSISHTFTSEDKTTLYGLHIQPESESKGLIVVANGLYKNMSYRFTQWLWIVEQGYEVFIFDYRGYGKSNADADLFGFRDDVNAAIEYAHSLDKTKEMVLVGQSMGGTFVIDALSIKKYNYISLVVVDSTFTGFDSMLSDAMMKSIVLFPLSWIPYTFVPQELNSIENISSVNTPILFTCCDGDWVVDSENSEVLYDKTKGKKSLWSVKDAGHVEAFNNLALRKSFINLLKDKALLTEKEYRFF